MTIPSLCFSSRVIAIGCALALASSDSIAQDRTSTTTTATRTSTTTATRVQPMWEPNLSSLLGAATSSSTFTIPGGGGDILNTQLWFKMTKLIATNTTDDASPDDEVYAIVGAVVLNWDKLWESKAYVRATPVYKDMSPGDIRSLNIPVWGWDNDLTIPIRSAKDIVLRISLYEHDSGMPFLAAAAAQAEIGKVISGLHPGYTYSEVYEKISHAFYMGVYPNATKAGDDVIGSYVTEGIFLTNDDLQSARSGTIVKKEKIFVSGIGDEPGKYTLRFQLGKDGVSSVVW